MAREVPVGILIKAKDGAAGVFKQVTEGAQKMGRGIDQASDRAKSAMDGLRKSVALVSHGMQIAERVGRVVAAAFRQTVGASLALRSENDKGRKSWEDFLKSTEKLKVSIGDVLIPILRGIADVLTPVIKGWTEWIKANREMIGMAVIPWLANVAEWLVTGVAYGADLAAQSWYGWKAAIHATIAAWHTAEDIFASGLSATGKAAEWASEKLKAMGIDTGSLSTNAREFARIQKGMATEQEAASARAQGDAVKAGSDMEKRIAQFHALKDAIHAAIGVAATNAAKNLSAAIEGIGKAVGATLGDFLKLEGIIERERRAGVERQEQKLKNLRKLEQENENARSAAVLEVEEKIRDADKKTNEERQAAAEETAATLESAFTSVADMVTEAFEGIDGHTKTIGDGFKQLGKTMLKVIRDIALKEILAAAARAIANAIAGHASIPFVGVVMGAGIGAAAAALILSQKGKFHSGGRVPGRRGADVPALLQAGELVVAADKADAAVSAGFGPFGAAPAMAGGGAPIVRIETYPPSRVIQDRNENDYFRRARSRSKKRGWSDE